MIVGELHRFTKVPADWPADSEFVCASAKNPRPHGTTVLIGGHRSDVVSRRDNNTDSTSPPTGIGRRSCYSGQHCELQRRPLE